MSEESLPLGGKVLTKPFLLITLLFLIGVVLVIYRYINGLGAVTNMSDGYPWGIWITYDVLVGTALGCGGYAMAFLVYVGNKGEYHPLVRSAVLTSMFGYGLAGVAIFFDIGRYWNGYNLLLPWYASTNSILLEVALCIAVYVVVLMIEFVPAILEGMDRHKQYVPSFLRRPDPKPAQRWFSKWLFVIVALGVLLPTMHQSSLGSLMIIAGRKLSPLWQTGLLPLLFLLSAITMGYAIVVFESLFSSLGFKRPLETPLLAKVSQVMGWMILAYLIIRFLDILVRGQFVAMFTSGLQSFMFWLENLLYLAPVIILWNAARRMNPGWLFVSATSMLLAGSLYRFNVYLVGFNPGPGWVYFPAFGEVMITVGVVAFELMGYLYFVKRFPVLPKVEHA